MRIGVDTSPDHLAEAHEAGFAFAEMGTSVLLPDRDDAAFAPVLEKLRATPLPVEAFNCFLPGSLKVTGPDVNLKAVGAHMDRVLRRAAQAGASIMVFGSGEARRVPDGFSVETAHTQFVAAARLAGETAARYNMTVTLEPLLKRATNFIHRVDEGIDVVDQVNHPRFRLLADLYHMAWESDPFDSLVRAGARLAHIHLATPTLPETGSDNGPGYDLPGFLAALRRAGYSGRISVEDNPDLFMKSKLPLAQVFRAIRIHVEACTEAAFG